MSNSNIISTQHQHNNHDHGHNIINRSPMSRSESSHQQQQHSRPLSINNTTNNISTNTNHNINQTNQNNTNNSNNNITSSFRSNSNLYPAYADQPDIVRALQKDEFYKKLFEDQVFEILTRLIGPRFIMNKQNESKLLSNVSYFVLTTLIGSQTLGEEYCNLRQIRNCSFSIPNIKERCKLMFYQLMAPYVIKKLMPKLFQRYPNMYSIKEILPKLERLHLALFYFNGSYYEFSKRLSNIRYIFNRKVDQKRPKYHILGFLIIIQLIVSTFIYLKGNSFFLSSSSSKNDLNVDQSDNINNNINNNNEELNGIGASQGKCTLCLEVRTHTTSTICGHLFCWYCLTEWCNSKAECPLCRRPISLQSLITTFNY